MNEKVTSRQLQAIETKKKIYNAARRLIRKKGFENISVSDICKAAEVSVGLYYHYYKSKNDILFEIYKRGDEYLWKARTNLKSPDAVGKIREYMYSYLALVESDGIDLARHLFTTENKMFAKPGRAMQTLLRDLIEDGQKSGELAGDMTPPEAVEFIFIVLRGMVFDWCLHDGHYNLSKSSGKIINYICCCLTAKKL